MHLGPELHLSQEKTMKKMQQFLAAAALTFLLSVSASAGIMEIGKVQPPPPPPPATTSMAAESEAVEDEGTMTTWVTTPEPVEELALRLLQSVLALF
jgi:hypothetical protein